MRELCTIVLATRNPGKIREIRQVLADLPVGIVALDDDSDIPEPPEEGATFADNAASKALYYARATGQWCLADDSGLEVDALEGRPGVHSARYAAGGREAQGDRAVLDEANNAKLLRELAGLADGDRTARFVCELALSDGEKILIRTRGVVEGRIAQAPEGDNGFGYDPLFFVPALGCTTAQLSPGDKNRISHRGKAARRFAELLREMLERQ
jgi:XTP/dITP diphosphohydrolase